MVARVQSMVLRLEVSMEKSFYCALRYQGNSVFTTEYIPFDLDLICHLRRLGKSHTFHVSSIALPGQATRLPMSSHERIISTVLSTVVWCGARLSQRLDRRLHRVSPIPSLTSLRIPPHIVFLHYYYSIVWASALIIAFTCHVCVHLTCVMFHI